MMVPDRCSRDIRAAAMPSRIYNLVIRRRVPFEPNSTEIVYLATGFGAVRRRRWVRDQ
jgi:hypothetical protein